MSILLTEGTEAQRAKMQTIPVVLDETQATLRSPACMSPYGAALYIRTASWLTHALLSFII